MVAQVLPGLRELRTPVAAGYLWLLTVWVALQPDPAALVEEPGIVGSLARAAETAGAVPTAAAITFVAYLLGSLSEGLWRLLPRAIYDAGSFGANRPILDAASEAEILESEKSGRATDLSEAELWGLRSGLLSWGSQQWAKREDRLSRDPVTPSTSALRSLGGYVESRLDDARARLDVAGIEPEVAVPELGLVEDVALVQPESRRRAPFSGFWRYRYGGIAMAVTNELELVFTRLIGTEPAVHATVDRLRAESDLRFAILPPLATLTAVLAWLTTVLWCLVLPAIGFLFRQGIRRRRESNDLLMDALVAGRVDAPSLERIERAVDEALRRQGIGRTPPADRIDSGLPPQSEDSETMYDVTN